MLQKIPENKSRKGSRKQYTRSVSVLLQLLRYKFFSNVLLLHLFILIFVIAILKYPFLVCLKVINMLFISNWRFVLSSTDRVCLVNNLFRFSFYLAIFKSFLIQPFFGQFQPARFVLRTLKFRTANQNFIGFRTVFMQCIYVVYLCTVFMNCIYVLYLCTVFMYCIYVMYLCTVSNFLWFTCNISWIVQ